MKKAIKLTNYTMTKNTIIKFNKSKVGLNDVEEIAETLVNKMKSCDKSRNAKYDIVKDLMKHKLKNAIKSTRVAKKELEESKENLSKVVRKATFVRSEFMELVDKELKTVWKESKEKSDVKVNWNIQKRIGKDDIQKGIINGILVGDKELENFEKQVVDVKKSSDDEKAVIYAGIKVSKAEEDILCLPPSHTIFPKVNIEEFDTDMEKCVIKCKWQARNEERKVEENNVREEAKEQNETIDKTVEDEANILDFRYIKPTDFKSNKRVILPDLEDDEEEIRRNNLKSELRKVVEKYQKDNCDKFGNIVDNNLNKTQLKTIKNLKQRMKEEHLALGETDKTGKLTLDTLDNISKKMNKHIEEDKIINDRGFRKLENKLKEIIFHKMLQMRVCIL